MDIVEKLIEVRAYALIDKVTDDADTVIDDAIVEIKRLRLLVFELVKASKEWHSVEDCRVEQRSDCSMCAAIKDSR